ncbi:MULTISPECIES: NAD(P)/FAD-dependent oxidoreductase [unclassified Wenzhouxiangella]|uniref:NAD(P)/FAD-dependent oxidoreductase n=1 Tax=unclassified Wenzhouxiangella TaxID=2613841 RepID=UPI000E325D8B|nr:MULTISPECIES: FAD-dependent oxidoreductase [unclassified Wenzhouxiangella]RFF28775.1 FAD-dependent oxidoreductase [Wenzhouxiangella sp. 15181]RFP67821.1 FAD-dependent oxidoreductase [Wenzhouxiangella sp. 15190]
MKIAIVGAGVSGLYAAWHLSQRHEVTVFEAEDRLGGHADTQVVDDEGVPRSIDTGFIVFNRAHYPLLTAWFEELGVESDSSDMSFGVSDTQTGLAYNASTLRRLYCQRRNLFSPRFHGMVLDIARFYRRAPQLLEEIDDRVTLGEWLEQSDLGEMFASRHMLPMASALWSAPIGDVTQFPMRHLLAFMDNHSMLTLGTRPQWETVRGGSRRYVEAAGGCAARFSTGTPVRSVERNEDGVQIRTPDDEARFDAVVLACHSDQALKLLDDASPVERCVLNAVDYQPNETVLHTDVSVLPDNPAARAAWNVRVDDREHDQCRVSYYMNKLQNIDSRQHYIVSLNQTDKIDPDCILVRRNYAHPVFTPEAVAAQSRWRDINGLRRTWFCGAWWGWGFHEDGARSARRVIDDIEARHG